jgi:hypothetical protein
MTSQPGIVSSHVGEHDLPAGQVHVEPVHWVASSPPHAARDRAQAKIAITSEECISLS